MFTMLEKERLKLYLGRKFVHCGNRMFPLVGHCEEFWSNSIFETSPLGIKGISVNHTSTGKQLDVFCVFENSVHLLPRIAVVPGMLVKFNDSNCCLFIKKKNKKQNNRAIVAWFQIHILRYLRYMYYYLKKNWYLTCTQKIGSWKNLEKFFRRNRPAPKNLTIKKKI